MSDVREIKITGGKSTDLIMKKRRTRKRQEGGDLEEEVVAAQGPIKISKVNEVASAPAPPAPAPPEPAPVPAPPVPVPVPVPVPATAPTVQNESSMQGGAAKVILKSKIAKQTKVLLKKKEPISGPSPPHLPPKTLKVKNRKVILHAITKKLNKTRHAMKHAKELPIEQVRAVLIDKKLIKSSSKAPDSILRQIYSDSLIVAKKTL